MKFFAILLLALAVAGCTTKSTARLKAQNAFLAGQNAALQQQLARRNARRSRLLGRCKIPRVPWVAGLTLAQAIATANYLGPHEPKQIIITRGGESATMEPKVLLNGTDIPLEVGRCRLNCADYPPGFPPNLPQKYF